MSRVVARRLHGGGDERVVRAGRHDVPLEQRPRSIGVSLGERQEGEVAPPQRRAGVGDDGPEPRDPPARSHERGGGRVLPPLQLGYAKRHDVRIGEPAAAL